jgi:hypothetical protein
MAPEAKRRKGATDQGESTGRVESLENVSKASEDIPRQLRSKKLQGSTIKEIGATLEAVIPSDHVAGFDDSKQALESSEINSTSSPTHSGEPVQEGIEANILTTEVADSGAVLPPNHIVGINAASKQAEEYTDVDVYHPPFIVYQRFIPDKNWNVDSKVSTPYNIFPDTGERRKKEVKDNFDWLQPAIRPADKSAARQAYVENYSFKDGFHTSDKAASYSKYSTPAMIMSRCANFTTYAMPMDHPLVNVEQATAWLAKPVGHLLN